MNNDNINKKNDSFNFTNVVKKINSDAEGTPWYKKKVSIISMSSALGVGALATVIAVPIALTSGTTVTNKDWTVSGIKSIYDLNAHYAKLIISGTKLPTEPSSYKVISSTIRNARGPITSNINLTELPGVGVQLGFDDSTLVATTEYQVEIGGHSTPIKTAGHILQPIINIETQPQDHTIANTETNKRVTLTVAATVQNQISGKSLTYQWQNSDRNDVSSFVNISGATNTSYEVDATSFPDAIKKYYRCVVSYEYTEAKPSSTVFVEKAAGSVTPPPPVVIPSEAIAAFNKKTVTEKLAAYNTIMADTTNNNAIKDYFIKNGGMSKFFIENIQPITSGDDKAIYDAFKAFLPTYKGAIVSNTGTNYNVEYTPTDGTNFLKIKAVGKTADGNIINYDDSNNLTNIYCSHGVFSGNIGRYNFYSPMVDTITNVTINSDFSITMSLSTSANIQNMAFRLINSSTINSHYISYKTTIKFSDTTLFPKMSEFVKKSILNLTV